MSTEIGPALCEDEVIARELTVLHDSHGKYMRTRMRCNWQIEDAREEHNAVMMAAKLAISERLEELGFSMEEIVGCLGTYS